MLPGVRTNPPWMKPVPRRNPLPAVAALLAILLVALITLIIVFMPPAAPVAGLTSPTPTLPTQTPSGAPTPTESALPSPTSTPEPTPTPTVTPTPATATIVRFRRIDFNRDYESRTVVDCVDGGGGTGSGMVHLQWTVDNAAGVSLAIAGPGEYKAYEGKRGDDVVPFDCGSKSTRYTLTTTGSVGSPATKQLTLTRGAPVISTFVVSKDIDSCTGHLDEIIGVRVRWSVGRATGVLITTEGEPPMNGGTTGDTVSGFDCADGHLSQKYKLTTTGGYGKAATKSVTLARP
jgi:hypothetical protein